MINKKYYVKALKASVWIALPIALISLMLCTLVIGSSVFETLLPLWLVIIFAVVSFTLTRIPFTAERLWLKTVVYAAVITVTVICLHIFC